MRYYKVYWTKTKRYSKYKFGKLDIALDFCRRTGKDAQITHDGHPVAWFQIVNGEECWGMHER